MNDPRVFVETSIFVRHLVQTPQEQAARATALFDRIEAGDVRAVTTDMVVLETVHVLGRHFRAPRNDIAQPLSALLTLPDIELAGRDDILRAFDLWLERPGLSFPDCVHIFNARRMAGG